MPRGRKRKPGVQMTPARQAEHQGAARSGLTPSGADNAGQARKALGHRSILAIDCALVVANNPETLPPI